MCEIKPKYKEIVHIYFAFGWFECVFDESCPVSFWLSSFPVCGFGNVNLKQKRYRYPRFVLFSRQCEKPDIG